VWVISPSRDDIMLAAASIAGADGLIWAGGAHGIAAAAYGTQTVPAVDIIVGPGNRWVTAAKKLVSGQVGIDMLAGPSELVVMADESADPQWVAADLLAQAEHDTDAVPILVTTNPAVVAAVRDELERQLKELDTAGIAAHAIKHGASIVCRDWDEAVSTVNGIGPEHLEVQHADAEGLVPRLVNYGGLFIGSGSAEVIGDYGAGPNHVLPTSGTARYTGGLSVFDFLRVRTWMEITDADQAQALYEDAESLATMEGLSGHATSARVRRPGES
jgi:phosphoribosyl-ATP pyrophosphohydrolase/phosphoribosyl-AMP cyclohydrolase/histidinol dehydrogenase